MVCALEGGRCFQAGVLGSGLLGLDLEKERTRISGTRLSAENNMCLRFSGRACGPFARSMGFLSTLSNGLREPGRVLGVPPPGQHF